MIERLTGLDAVKNAERRLTELIEAHGEWFYARTGGGTQTALRKGECDFRAAHGHLIFSSWDDGGALSWRIVAWEWTGEKLLLEATRRTGAERAVLELIPRASVS